MSSDPSSAPKRSVRSDTGADTDSAVVDIGVPGGPLKRRVHSSDPEDTRNGQAFLEWCPVCGPDGPHFEGQGRFAWHLYSEHEPEDFGLSPIGDRD